MSDDLLEFIEKTAASANDWDYDYDAEMLRKAAETIREQQALLEECVWALQSGVWPFVDAMRVADILSRIKNEPVKAEKRPIP